MGRCRSMNLSVHAGHVHLTQVHAGTFCCSVDPGLTVARIEPHLPRELQDVGIRMAGQPTRSGARGRAHLTSAGPSSPNCRTISLDSEQLPELGHSYRSRPGPGSSFHTDAPAADPGVLDPQRMGGCTRCPGADAQSRDVSRSARLSPPRRRPADRQADRGERLAGGERVRGPCPTPSACGAPR